jgi:RNase P/RNase MRP subunit p29
VALRLKLGQADLDGMLARVREIKEASMRGRAGEAVSVRRNSLRRTAAEAAERVIKAQRIR